MVPTGYGERRIRSNVQSGNRNELSSRSGWVVPSFVPDLWDEVEALFRIKVVIFVLQDFR